jgi:hypothetical protein
VVAKLLSVASTNTYKIVTFTMFWLYYTRGRLCFGTTGCLPYSILSDTHILASA